MRYAAVFMMLAGPAFADGSGPLLSGLDAFVVEGVDVYVLGEVHDNPEHHLRQAALIEAIAPSAVLFEMLDAAGAVRAEQAQGADVDALGEALEWDDSGWPDFAMYYPVFESAGAARIGGVAVGIEDVRAAMDRSAAQVFGEDAVAWGLDQPLTAGGQADFELEMQESHCNALPEAMLPAFVEAQRLRDAAFAKVVAEAFDAYGGPVVLITGNGHARTDRAVPAFLAEARPELTVRALGQFENALPENAPFDAVAISPEATRDDPCAAFR